MLISPLELERFFGVRPHGVLHVGAHKAEEASDYVQLNWEGKSKIYWVEADPKFYDDLVLTLDPKKHRVICAAAWHQEGEEREFIRTSSSQSSSLLELEEHLRMFPDIKEESRIRIMTKRIDNLLSLSDNFNFINIDTQGSEIFVLMGVGQLILQVQYIYCEVNTKELYKGVALLPELDCYLNNQGFKRIVTKWTTRDSGWGDALYVRSDAIPCFVKLRKFFFKLNRIRKLRNPTAIWNLAIHEIK